MFSKKLTDDKKKEDVSAPENDKSADESGKMYVSKTVHKPRAVLRYGLVTLVGAALLFLAINFVVNEIQNQNTVEGVLKRVSKKIGGGSISKDRAAPDYTVPGYDFAAVGLAQNSSTIMATKPLKDFEKTFSEAQTQLLRQGFKKSSTQVKDARWGLVKYENQTILCGLSHNKPDVAAREDVRLYLSCALKSTYSAVAKTQKPFYVAYRKAVNNQKFQSLAEPLIEDSRTGGYKLAKTILYNEGNLGESLGLFYKAPNGEWTFFKDSPYESACSDFNTPDLQKAFVGEVCMNGPNLEIEQTVTPQ